MVLQHSQQQPISIQVATKEQQALSGAIANNGEELHRQSSESAQESRPPEISQQIILDDGQGVGDGAIAVPSESPQPNLEVAKSLESLQVSEPQIPADSHQVDPQPELEPPTELPDVEGSPNERSPSLSARQVALLKTPLLPQYEHLIKSEAIEQLLQENEGKVLHVNYIIRALHGELKPEDIAAEKPRMSDSLKKGIAKGLWDRVLDSPGYYTIDMKLVDKEVSPKKVEEKKPQKRKPNNKATERMLPRYQNLTFTDAVEIVLRDRSSEIITSDIMARALYSDLEGQDLVEARNKVGKVLWSGGSQGRWQSVPGQKGAYTLNLKLVDS